MVAPLVLALVLGAAAAAGAQSSGGPPAPGQPHGEAVQHGAQPNPQEVRPGSPEGDAPSAAVGEIVREPERRILGLPVTAALVIGAAIALLIAAGIAIPASRRRNRPRGDTY